MFELYDLYTVEYIKKKLYHNHIYRYTKDKHVISACNNIIILLKNIQLNRTKMSKEDREQIPGYFKMKVETFEKILNDNEIRKPELLTILFLLKLYKITYYREHRLKINETIIEIMGGKNPLQYKKNFFEIIEKLKNWKYTDDSIFIKDYRIEKDDIIIILDEKQRV